MRTCFDSFSPPPPNPFEIVTACEIRDGTYIVSPSLVGKECMPKLLDIVRIQSGHRRSQGIAMRSNKDVQVIGC